MILAALLVVALLQDPVTGVWKGTTKGNGVMLPEQGVPTSFWLTRADDGKVGGKVYVQGFETLDFAGTFDQGTSRLAIESSVNGVPMTIEVTLAEDALEGTIAGMGLSFPVTATRISHDVLAEPPAPSAPVAPESLSDDDWTEDLMFLAEYLPQVHANAYHTLSAEEWRDLVDRTADRLLDLEPRARSVALAQLVAKVGDAHTGLDWREQGGFDRMPIDFGLFSDGLFVIGVDEAWEGALGARVKKLGKTSPQQAAAAVATVFASENEAWKKAQTPGLLTIPRLLFLLGELESPDRMPLVLEPGPGIELPVAIEAKGKGRRLVAPNPVYEKIPLWRTRRDENYWYTVLIDDGAVYLAYNKCAEDPQRPIAEFLKEVLDACDTAAASKLVIDLRNNSGGNSAILGDHIESLVKPERELAVLIGPVTYSSGMLNAHELRSKAGAVLYGEPTGGKPNSYGEMRSFRLPNSGLRVFYTTKFFRLLPGENPPSVMPDVTVELSSKDYFAGEDPVLRRVLGG